MTQAEHRLGARSSECCGVTEVAARSASALCWWQLYSCWHGTEQRGDTGAASLKERQLVNSIYDDPKYRSPRIS